MPLYGYQCDGCGLEKEILLTLKECDMTVYCGRCGMEMRKVLFPVITCLPHDKRKWGTSLYRRHEKGEKLKKGRSAWQPLLKRKGELK